jgi:hypothetical protein
MPSERIGVADLPQVKMTVDIPHPALLVTPHPNALTLHPATYPPHPNATLQATTPSLYPIP